MMGSKPFFSVVIPVYNSEKYLNTCIESVFAQTCGDFELILVDDESKDSSSQICDRWAAGYEDKVRVIHQKNTGVYIAKRNGIKASRGRYIYVIDNDDLITSPTAFAEIKERLENTGCDLVFFHATDNIETGHRLCKFFFEDGEIFEEQKLSILYDEFLSTKKLHHIWMMVFSRELFDWEYKYNEVFRMLRDGPSLILPILSRAKRVLYLDKTYYYWRVQNLASASKHYDVQTFFLGIRSLHKRVKAYSQLWEFKSEKTDDLVKKNYIADVCIAAIKVRNISACSWTERRACLEMMANDPDFRKEYTQKYLEKYRKPIAWALYHRQFWLVQVASTLAGAVKDRLENKA